MHISQRSYLFLFHILGVFPLVLELVHLWSNHSDRTNQAATRAGNVTVETDTNAVWDLGAVRLWWTLRREFTTWRKPGPPCGEVELWTAWVSGVKCASSPLWPCFHSHRPVTVGERESGTVTALISWQGWQLCLRHNNLQVQRLL